MSWRECVYHISLPLDFENLIYEQSWSILREWSSAKECLCAISLCTRHGKEIRTCLLDLLNAVPAKSISCLLETALLAILIPRGEQTRRGLMKSCRLFHEEHLVLFTEATTCSANTPASFWKWLNMLGAESSELSELERYERSATDTMRTRNFSIDVAKSGWNLRKLSRYAFSYKREICKSNASFIILQSTMRLSAIGMRDLEKYRRMCKSQTALLRFGGSGWKGADTCPATMPQLSRGFVVDLVVVVSVTFPFEPSEIIRPP